jgi:O-methyltransferase
MNPIGKLRALAGQQLRRQRWKAIYRSLSDFTMIPREIYFANLALAESVQQVPGCVVECGVWRGGMSAGLARVLGPGRSYLLFDSFEGLPKAKSVDGDAALRWQSDTTSPGYYDNCAAPPEFAQRAMTLSGATKFELIKGWFENTIPTRRFDEPIALLRLDGDWYESTMTCLENLYDRVTEGGLIILDDYYTWDGCSRALHDFLSRRSAPERIRSCGSVCYLQKLSPLPAGRSAPSTAASPLRVGTS